LKDGTFGASLLVQILKPIPWKRSKSGSTMVLLDFDSRHGLMKRWMQTILRAEILNRDGVYIPQNQASGKAAVIVSDDFVHGRRRRKMYSRLIKG
jgi:hypothetical protein